MNQEEFWEKANQRARENMLISRSGMPNTFAGVMEWVGLKFLVVGGALSFIVSTFLWFSKYDAIMRFVRVIVWR